MIVVDTIHFVTIYAKPFIFEVVRLAGLFRFVHLTAELLVDELYLLSML